MKVMTMTMTLAMIVIIITIACPDEPMVAGGKLRARQDPEALWDDSSRRWRIRLACGVFTFLGPPPFNVSWTVSFLPCYVCLDRLVGLVVKASA